MLCDLRASDFVVLSCRKCWEMGVGGVIRVSAS